MKPLYSHVDLRVRDRERAVAFYDPLMQAFGFTLAPRKAGDEWPTWRRPGGHKAEFFGFEVDAKHVPNESRIAFFCVSKEEVDHVAAVAAKAGAVDVDGPLEYSPTYYACFFDDPDGNKLEICCLWD